MLYGFAWAKFNTCTGELLTPKTVLFFALFLPPFVSAGAGEASVQAQLLFGAADRYSVGYCHGITGAHCDQIHQ